MSNHITILGDSSHTGAYVLWLEVRADLALSFGRFRGGRVIAAPAGHYAYAGSALGRGAASLAGRLLRHATRRGDRPPHAIRPELAARLAEAGLLPAGGPLPAAKRLRWHIDYLLDEIAVEIVGVTAIRTGERLESDLARRLAGLPGAVPLAAGLGASDAPGEIHLLRLPDNQEGLFAYTMATPHHDIMRSC
jgi:Uri superfamily endonuclease